jgi:UDP-N-acetylglucosamine 2-epimerase
LLILHPADADDQLEQARAELVLNTLSRVPFERMVVVYPNNDPGSSGIMKFWESVDPGKRIRIHRDLPRSIYLGLLRDAAVLIGNSSSGIIEAASFGTPVLDIGPRQLGRERGNNVMNVPYSKARIERELRRIWNNGHPKRFKADNIYGGGGAARVITTALARIPLNDRLLRKLIRY